MIVSFDVPSNVQELLVSTGRDPNQVAKEALLLELFRQRQLSHYELAQQLGLDRAGTEAVLRRHGIYDQSLTLEDIEADHKTLQQLLGTVS